MAETHILQHVAAFAFAMWWTKQWLVTRPVSRWRFALSALSGSILWVYVAYSATRAVDTSGGVTVVFGSLPLAYFSAFMALLSVVGIFIGLLLWTEEEVEKSSENIPEMARSKLGGD